MAVGLLRACDDYQLRLFATLIFYGLRAAEPTYLFGEHLDDQWLRVPCIPELGYTTKGKRDKRLPLFEPLKTMLGRAKPGLLFVRRAVAEGREQCPLLGQLPIVAGFEELLLLLRRKYDDRAALLNGIRSISIARNGFWPYGDRCQRLRRSGIASGSNVSIPVLPVTSWALVCAAR
jgi:hypothetical protein